MLDVLDCEFGLDDIADLHAYGLSIRTAAQLDLPLLDHEDSGVTYPADDRLMYRAPEAFIPYDEDVRESFTGYSPDRTDPTLLAKEAEADESEVLLAWLHRCDVTSADVARWTVDPEAAMTEEQKAARSEARAAWRTDQLRIRKVQLHRLLQTWFGRTDYRACTVTVWIDDETKPKGVRPEELNVLAWISSHIEKNGELAGIASCAALTRRRLARRKGRRIAT